MLSLAPTSLLMLSLALAGCGVSTNGPWHEVRTDHFLIAARVSEPAARTQAARLETALASLSSLAAPGRPLPPRVDVLWLPGDDDPSVLVPDSTGYFLPRQPGEPTSPPLIVVGGGAGRELDQRIIHELSHLVFVAVAPDAPPWVAEGLAGFYSSIDLDRGSIGNPVTESAHQKMMYGNRGWVSDAARLRAADESFFHQQGTGPGYYRAARNFVMMLVTSSFWRPRFDDFLARLAKQEPAAQAWAATLQPYEAKLEADYHDFQAGEPTPLPLATWKGTPSVQPLPPAAVERWLARSRPWDSREALVAAGKSLARAAADDSAERHYWSGVYAARWRRWPIAAAELQAAVARDPAFAPARAALERITAGGAHH